VRRLGAPLCFALALGVKETAVTFPLALLLWDVSCGQRWRAALRRAWPSWLLLLLAASGFLASGAYRAAMERSLEFNTLTGNAATQLDALVYLARQAVLPLWLNIDPDLPVRQDFSHALPGSLLLLGALAATVWHWRRRPWLGFALAWALLHWLPLYVFLPRLDVANDRQLYLALWPLCLALVLELYLRCSARTATTVLAALLLGAGGLTLQRNQDFHSEVALWEQTVRLSPDKSRVHNNLGYAYKEAGQAVQARRAFLDALERDPDNFRARLNLRRLNLERAAKKPK
jgi:tetratricopeptide (TPR) repeat protein